MKKGAFSTISKISLAVALLFSTACSKEFLDRKPLDSLTANNYYSSAKALDAATSILYNVPWFDYNDKAAWAVGDMLAGNLNSYDSQVLPFKKFELTGDNPRIAEGWSSMYKVVAHANNIINTMPANASPDLDKKQINRCLGEAHFMRAVAYFYLVRAWGAVPIIENNTEKINDFQVPRHRVVDVYTLIIRDLEFAEANCPKRSEYGGADKARVTSGAAKGMMAKVYLAQNNYDKALVKAEEVINSREYELMSDYEELFKTASNVNLSDRNKETMFALLWDVDNGGWGVQNTCQAFFAPFGQGITGFSCGWGSGFPTIDLVKAYEAGDKRKRATVMSSGDTYPYMTVMKNGVEVAGYTYPTKNFPSETYASVKKYVVGSPAGNGGKGGFMRTYINTNILRYSDVLLIAAESIAKGSTSSDAKALSYFNAVRTRAGLEAKTSFNIDDMHKERRVELAIENDYWYDLVRMDRTRATRIIADQERGTYYQQNNQPVVNSLKFVPKPTDFLLPIPTADVTSNPKLREAPVEYKF
jgi:starch-binding outer membrane protein, SusD/RagB family